MLCLNNLTNWLYKLVVIIYTTSMLNRLVKGKEYEIEHFKSDAQGYFTRCDAHDFG
ncbi:hypothetical protein LGAA44_80047 [Leuconostoc gasicomitatum]|nr:hypothetical protein LGAA44_80047 [Leuconostoc gasicomitatum]